MIWLLTPIAMLAFAANSLLARAALGDGTIDPASFTAIRLMSGAVVLAWLLAWQDRRLPRPVPGSWASTTCLMIYGFAFSYAYGWLGAATGALILFGAVQATMLAASFASGHRPSRLELLGLILAAAAFVALLLPGLHAPNPLGAALMAAAGIAWGFYSLRGRRVTRAMTDTAGNFLRSAALCLPIAISALWLGHADARGVALALISGMLASALGYIIWYRALAGLLPLQAASVQLTVPLIAALGAALLLGEWPGSRVMLSGVALLGGVGMTLAARRRGRG
jgi:drug/metabolite transporter (DMT)-like permease